MAYLNVDVAVRGPAFKASAAPLLNNLLANITAQVPSPNQTVAGQTVYDVWDKKISTMGSGSDFTAFQDFAGIPSLDMGFNGGGEDPVYHYHSNYDSFAWMAQYGDPGFVYHRTMAQIFGLMTAKLADEPLLSFEAATYASALDSYVGKVEDKLAAAALSSSSSSSEGDEDENEEQDKDERMALRGAVLGTTTIGSPAAFRRSLTKLHEAIAALLVEATRLDAKRAALQAEVAGEKIPWWQWPKKFRLAYEVRKVNTKYKYLERDFLYPEGLDGRSWFKHVVFAPGLWTGYAGGELFFFLLLFFSPFPFPYPLPLPSLFPSFFFLERIIILLTCVCVCSLAVFPGLVESIDAKDYNNAVRWSGIIEDCIKTATANIKVGHHG